MALACSRELIVLQNSLTHTHTEREVPGSQPVLLCPDSWERPLEPLGSCSSSWLCGSVALGTSLSSASSCQGSCQALFGGLCSLCLNCHHLILSVFLVKAWQVCDISWSLTVLGVGDFWVTPGPFGGANPAGCWLCPAGLPVVFPAGLGCPNAASLVLPALALGVGPSLPSAPSGAGVDTAKSCLAQLWASFPSLQIHQPTRHKITNPGSLVPVPSLFHSL